MSNTPVPADLRARLLADRGLLNLETSISLLVSRARIRTPLGACEFLRARQYELEGMIERSVYEERVGLAATTMNLFFELFPRQYNASQNAPYSIEREQEFYRLVGKQLFPLECPEPGEEPDFFLPFIPVKGHQQHDWINGCCGFDGLQTVFRLVLVLGGQEHARWSMLGLDNEPAPPLGSFGWTLFIYACSVDEGPIRHLPMAFNMVGYQTGNIWLDAPPGMATFGFEWSGENIAKLFLHRLQADDINNAVLSLNKWLVADRNNLLRAVEIWNVAAKKEKEEMKKLEQERRTTP